MGSIWRVIKELTLLGLRYYKLDLVYINVCLKEKTQNKIKEWITEGDKQFKLCFDEDILCLK